MKHRIVPQLGHLVAVFPLIGLLQLTQCSENLMENLYTVWLTYC